MRDDPKIPSMIYGNYAEVYDLVFQDKCYEAEADHVSALLGKYGQKKPRSLLDCGCGTGSHALSLASKGYRVTGIDNSERMLRSARQKTSGNPRFLLADMTAFSLRRKFDAVLCLFNVVQYFVGDEQMRGAIRSVGKHLAAGGLFIFDSWYGPAVKAHPPAPRIKRCENRQFHLTRESRPSAGGSKNSVNVAYRIALENKKTKNIRHFEECHKVRYFFLPEIKKFLKEGGFELVYDGEWMTGRSPGRDTWNICYVARKK